MTVDPLTVLREARVHQAGYVIDTTRGNWLRCADCGGEWEEDDDGRHVQGDMACLPDDVRAALADVEQLVADMRDIELATRANVAPGHIGHVARAALARFEGDSQPEGER